jgi:hypothetical protein
MNKTNTNPTAQSNRFSRLQSRTLGRKLAAVILLAGITLLAAVPVRAQTVTMLMTNANIFVGANFNGIYTNSQLRVVPSGVGANSVTLSVSGLPAGATILFSTNGYALTANPINFTNSWNMFYSVAVTNVTKGVYPLTFTCSGAANASAVVNLIVGTRWVNPNATGDVGWSNGTNWSTGTAPGSGDDVMFQDAGNTNYMNGSVSVNSLTFLPLQNATNQNMLIGSGQTLSVVGTNGFAINNDSVTANNKTYTLNIYGAGGALVVTNSSANFTINADNTGAAGSTVTMTNLDNFSATVNRFGLGDWTMAQQGGVGANFVLVSFAKTNVITAKFAGDYGLTNLNPKFSISLLQNGDPFNNGSANTINLGISNAIVAESLGHALNRAGGNPNNLRFNPVFTNGVLPYVSFRNTNGGRMNLIGVGIDSGISNPGSNARGVMNFSGGIVDMLVDTMWLGRDRAMSGTTNTGAVSLGVLTFTGGKIDVNYLRAGYMAYTNNSTAQGQINVGGSASITATLSVNTNLELGFTVGDVSATPGSIAAGSFGQVTIFTNGIVRANKVTVGTLSANDFITINGGGLLDVTNTIADTNKLLSTLTLVSGKLTLHLTSTNTVIYVTNLTASGVAPNASLINIASISGISSFPVVIPVISYLNGAAAAINGGTAPGGVNVSVANDTVNKVINVTLTTGTPKSLVWKAYVDNNWDVTTTNWMDVATGFPTNFATGDNVIFDDTAASSSVNVAVDVVPRQSIGVAGIAMTNNLLAYTFGGPGGILGSASFVKAGTNTVEIDNHTEVGLVLNQGTLQGSGDIGSVSIGSGTVMT